MQRRIPSVPATTFSSLITTTPKRAAVLLPVIARHDLAFNDLQLACDLSDLLRESISKGSTSTYSCGFKSLTEFCKLKKLSFLPVDAVTLCAWMSVKCKSVKVKSVIKYVCGIRFAHILEGLEWNLSSDPLVTLTISSLKKKYPTSDILQKIPLSLTMLLQMCHQLVGWPVLSHLSFDDLAWATASCIGFFACLRGGEFFVQPKSDRPILTGAAVSLRSSPSGPYVYIEVPSPKTRKDLVSIPALASCNIDDFAFNPVKLLSVFRARAAALSIDVLGANAAFKSRNGKPIDRAFMISRAERLRAAAKIVILNSDGKPIKVSAASWRAGFVMSARQANITGDTIRSSGRWKSVGGPIPYSVDTLDTYQSMTAALVSNHTTRTQRGPGLSSAGGHFASSSLLLQAGPVDAGVHTF